MPRPKPRTKIENLMFNYAFLKEPTLDILSDFAFILNYQVKKFRDAFYAADEEYYESKMKTAQSNKVPPTHKNRLYLICDVDSPQLVLFDVDECIIDNILWECPEDIFEIQCGDIPPSFYTIFIFEKADIYIRNVNIRQYSELLRCFYKENALSNSRVRDHWHGEPRRKQKSQDRLAHLSSGNL